MEFCFAREFLPVERRTRGSAVVVKRPTSRVSARSFRRFFAHFSQTPKDGQVDLLIHCLTSTTNNTPNIDSPRQQRAPSSRRFALSSFQRSWRSFRLPLWSFLLRLYNVTSDPTRITSNTFIKFPFASMQMFSRFSFHSTVSSCGILRTDTRQRPNFQPKLQTASLPCFLVLLTMDLNATGH